MAFYKVLLQSVLILIIVKNTDANFSADEVYFMLSAKIDVMQNEMSALRRILKSTKTELTSAKAELVSTQTEVDNLKAECGLLEKTYTAKTAPGFRTANTTNIKPERMNCCQVVKNAIMRMKAHQKQTREEIENRNEHKIESLNRETKALIEEMASNNLEMEQRKKEMTKVTDDVSVLSKNFKSLTQQMRNEIKDVKEEATNNTRDRVILERNMAKITENLHELSINQNELSNKVEQQQTSFIEEIQIAKMSLIKTKAELNQLSEDLRELSDKHKILAETVKIQNSEVKAVIKTEVNKVERCQSGSVSGYDLKTNPFPAIYTVVFQRPFTKKPVFSIGASMLDIYHKANLRISAQVTELSETRAKVSIRTWADTRAYGARFSWIACPT